MGNIPVKVGARVASIGGYYDQIEVYDEKCKKVLQNNPYGTLPNGSLAWPGDPELLESYGVRIEEISLEFKNVIQIIDEIPNFEERNIIQCAIDHYDVVKTILFPKQEKYCEYCRAPTIHETEIKITNLLTREELILTDEQFHMIINHGDLGICKGSRLQPEKVCNLFGLGNTNLSESDSLFKVAKYNHLNFKDLKDQMVKDGDLIFIDMNATLMMSATSGRGRSTDDDSF